MAVVAVPFTHFHLTCKKGDELPDDHELVELAPHLFVQTTKATPKKARP